MFFLRDASGQESGPFSVSEIVAWIESGNCSLFAEARREDQARWRLLGAFTEFARAVPGVALEESRQTRSGFEMISAKADKGRPPSPPPMSEEKEPERVRHVAPPPVVNAKVRWQPPPAPEEKKSGQSRKNGRPVRAVPLEKVAEEETVSFRLPKWAWSVWLTGTAIWSLAALANDQFSFLELMFKIFLLPWIVAYFTWGKLGRNENYAAAVFLGLSLFLQLASCAA